MHSVALLLLCPSTGRECLGTATNASLGVDVAKRFEFLLRLQPDDLQDRVPAEQLLVQRSEIPVLDSIAIQGRVNELVDTGSPLAGIEAFLAALHFGFYPPQSVLRWMEQALLKWHEHEGRMSMDEAMGLRGFKTPVFKAALLHDRDERLMLEMDNLIFLGATRPEAAGLVARRMEQEDWNKSLWDLPDLDAETIGKKHVAWSKDQDKRLLHESLQRITADPAWVRSFLSKYDHLYLPKALKSRA